MTAFYISILHQNILLRIQQIILRKLPCRNLLLKHNIQLLKRPPPTLRDPIPTPNQTHQTNGPEKIPRLSPPIRLVAI